MLIARNGWPTFVTFTNTQTAVTEVEERGGKTRKDANHEHFNEFWKGQIRAYKRFFGPIGPEQIHLQILATLPDFQRRGHGSSLCKWAMELVMRDALNDMSVMASPMGNELYTWLGFENVGTFHIQIPGESQRLVLHAMMYRPNRLRTATARKDAESSCCVVI
jgi:ribosomal protein S18 acetylase RimI-like enzyme